jgi:hypothetical protein
VQTLTRIIRGVVPILVTPVDEREQVIRIVIDQARGRAPRVIQDTRAAPVPAPPMRRIAEESERARYARVKSLPQPTQVQAAVRASRGLLAIVGGAA